MKYAVIDLWLPRRIQGHWVNTFHSSGHFINGDSFSLAIHFLRLSEWRYTPEFEGSDICDPKGVYKQSWRFAFLGVVIDWTEE